MFSGFVGLTAMAVSLDGATPSQSVFTLASVLDVVQIGPLAFRYCENPTPLSGDGFGNDLASAGIGAATATSARNAVTNRIRFAVTSITSDCRRARTLRPGASRAA